MTTSLSKADPSRPGVTGPVVISVDAMGGDRGPAAVVAGIEKSAEKNPDIRFIVHGPEDELRRMISRRKGLADRCDIRNAPGVVTMDDKPAQVIRQAQDTSMWSAIESVRAGEATVAVSCGNTGALMALSTLRLRKLPGVNRPAIAVLWPSRVPQGFNVILDVGADIKADATDLLQYAMMGASYARNGLGLQRPRIGLLNVGTEDHKGRPKLVRYWLMTITGGAFAENDEVDELRWATPNEAIELLTYENDHGLVREAAERIIVV